MSIERHASRVCAGDCNQSGRSARPLMSLVLGAVLTLTAQLANSEPVSMAENPASSPPHNNQPDACAHAEWVARNNAAAMAHTTNISILAQECRNCRTLDTTGTAQEGTTVWVCTAYVQWKRN
jgi:hypothetical protein